MLRSRCPLIRDRVQLGHHVWRGCLARRIHPRDRHGPWWNGRYGHWRERAHPGRVRFVAAGQHCDQARAAGHGRADHSSRRERDPHALARLVSRPARTGGGQPRHDCAPGAAAWAPARGCVVRGVHRARTRCAVLPGGSHHHLNRTRVSPARGGAADFGFREPASPAKGSPGRALPVRGRRGCEPAPHRDIRDTAECGMEGYPHRHRARARRGTDRARTPRRTGWSGQDGRLHFSHANDSTALAVRREQLDLWRTRGSSVSPTGSADHHGM